MAVWILLCMALNLLAISLFLVTGTAWDGHPDIALGILVLIAALHPPAYALIAWQWRVRGVHRKPRLAAWTALAGLAAWSGYTALFASALSTAGPMALQLSRDAAEQRSRPGIEISPDGTLIVMRMEIIEGTTERVKAVMRGHPGIRTVELSGPGGLEKEGIALAWLIRQRGLDTRVQRYCYSACALAFLAGRHREVVGAPWKGYVGLHPPSYGGEGASRRPGDSAATDEALRTSGATEAFVHRVDEAPIDDVWRPSPAEFAAGGVPVTVVDRYGLPGDLWGARIPARERTLQPMRLDDGTMAALRDGDGDAISATVDWVMHARSRARNEAKIGAVAQEALGRVVALRISRAGDADVRKAATYLHAGMVAIRDGSRGDCARLGARPNLLVAASAQPGPPDAASDPVSPYGALLRRVYGGRTHRGWPEGIGLPDGTADGFWARVGRTPRPAESCDALIAWYAWAIEPGNADGVAALRDRFAGFARTGVLTTDGGAAPAKVVASER